MKRRRRLLLLLLIGVVLIVATVAYIEFHFHLPEGDGPAGPAVPAELFSQVLAAQP